MNSVIKPMRAPAHTCTTLSGVVLLMLVLAMCSSLSAQALIAKGPVRPYRPAENTWFLNTASSAVERYNNQKWVLQGSGYSDISVCNELIILRYLSENERLSGMLYEVMDPWTGAIAFDATWCYCGDKILGVEEDSVITFFSNIHIPNKLPEKLTQEFLPATHPLQPMIFKGLASFSVPATMAIYIQARQSDLAKNWGLLGTNGQWLIEPKFDAPFHFQNGIADVIYYGEKRKINEKGEFVD